MSNSRYKISTVTIFLLLFLNPLYAQIGTTIPLHRKVNWETVGYHRSPKDNLPQTNDYNEIIQVEPPTGDYTVDYDNIMAAIEQARILSSENYRVLVQLQSGEYIINDNIVLSSIHSFITIRGVGANFTTIRRKLPLLSGNIKTVDIRGSDNNALKFIIDSYNAVENKVFTLNPISSIAPGSYIEVRVPNSNKWCEEFNSSCLEDFLGQIVQVKDVIGNNTLILEDDLNTFWQIIESEPQHVNTYFKSFETVQEIGIEDLELTMDEISLSEVYSNDFIGNTTTHNHISFSLATDCWVNNIKSSFAKNQHLSISRSHSIEVRNSYFNDAQFHGINGHGYGVLIQNRSTNCLVENNIFQRLRHSMMLAHSAHKNVFGYNYSFETKAEGAFENASKDPREYVHFYDISIHGFYPYANLFEGNRVDEVLADKYHTSNGVYNTLFRNYTYYNRIKLEETDKSNVIGNRGELIIENSSETFHLYGYVNGIAIPQFDSNASLSDISYYHLQRPSFLSQGFTWPPIGPRIDNSSQSLSQTIPARENFINMGYCESPFIDCNSIVTSNDLSVTNTTEFLDTKVYYGGEFHVTDELPSPIPNFTKNAIVACDNIYLKDGFIGQPDGDSEFRFKICIPNVNTVYSGGRISKSGNDMVTLIEKSLESDIVAYPNPSKGIYHVNYGSRDDQLPFIVILDSYGRRLFQIIPKTNPFVVDISNRTDGIYILKIVTNSKTESIKLLKK